MNTVRWFRQPHAWLILSTAVFVIYFSLTAWFRHVNFYTSMYDLGNMDSVLWHTLHGKWFVMTDPTAIIQQSRTAYHADFLLLGYLPFYALWSDPRVMMIIQVLAVASGAIPLFWLGRKLLSPTAGALFSIAYLTYPGLLWALIFDVHAVVLAAPLLLWAFWAIMEHRFWLYGVFIGLALLSKEEVGLVVGLLGLYFLFTKHPRVVSIATAIVGFGWSALILGWAIPTARTVNEHFAIGYFSEFGGTTGEVFRNVATNPLAVIRHLFRFDSLGYVAWLLWPLSFTSLLGWPLLLVAAPEFGINLLSNNPNLRSIFFHYASVITPLVFLAALTGLSWWRRKFAFGKRFKALALTAMIGVWAVALYSGAPLPGTRHHEDAVRVFRPSPYRATIAEIKRRLPPNAKVAVTNSLAPHFTQRDWAWMFPLALDRADAAIILLGGRVEVKSRAELRAAVRQLSDDPAWRLVIHQDQLYYFERVRSLAQT
ncbi:MAG: DUF2079 domain-containing protein [Candidatus Kerfeldbacteria bacterium]|nr:DUF2079 domain-containing protein [Candidatus Kerfeldbacteria bacterium]